MLLKSENLAFSSATMDLRLTGLVAFTTNTTPNQPNGGGLTTAPSRKAEKEMNMNAMQYITTIDGNKNIQQLKEKLFIAAPDFEHAIKKDANELAALRAENAKLREALEVMVYTVDGLVPNKSKTVKDALNVARAALGAQ